MEWTDSFASHLFLQVMNLFAPLCFLKPVILTSSEPWTKQPWLPWSQRVAAKSAALLSHQTTNMCSFFQGFGRSRSLSLPRQLNSMPSPRLLSPMSAPGTRASFLPAQRQTSFQENVYKPLSPWEAASRNLLGSVDEAFRSLPSSVASNVKVAGQRRSLPEPPDEWKRRVSLDPAAVTKSHYHAAPAFQAPSLSRTFSPEKPALYGPPFRPAQPLWAASRASIGYMGQGSSPTNYSPLYSAVPRS